VVQVVPVVASGKTAGKRQRHMQVPAAFGDSQLSAGSRIRILIPLKHFCLDTASISYRLKTKL
jgi:hypothetical protein